MGDNILSYINAMEQTLDIIQPVDMLISTADALNANALKFLLEMLRHTEFYISYEIRKKKRSKASPAYN